RHAQAGDGRHGRDRRVAPPAGAGGRDGGDPVRDAPEQVHHRLLGLADGGAVRRAGARRRPARAARAERATADAGRADDPAPPEWRPSFLDYLYLSFTNATAFSPTDTMPLTHWAKMLMLVESAASLLTLLMVAARAVNILS